MVRFCLIGDILSFLCRFLCLRLSGRRFACLFLICPGFVYKFLLKPGFRLRDRLIHKKEQRRLDDPSLPCK